jgi:hypothetical protein
MTLPPRYRSSTRRCQKQKKNFKTLNSIPLPRWARGAGRDYDAVQRERWTMLGTGRAWADCGMGILFTWTMSPSRHPRAPGIDTGGFTCPLGRGASGGAAGLARSPTLLRPTWCWSLRGHALRPPALPSRIIELGHGCGIGASARSLGAGFKSRIWFEHHSRSLLFRERRWIFLYHHYSY